jgi:hypothetical protein
MFEEEEIRDKGRQSDIRDNQKRSQSATLPRTANEAPVRIQYKCLVSHLCIPRKETIIFQKRIIMFYLPVPTLIYLCEIFMFPG